MLSVFMSHMLYLILCEQQANRNKFASEWQISWLFTTMDINPGCGIR